MITSSNMINNAHRLYEETLPVPVPDYRYNDLGPTLAHDYSQSQPYQSMMIQGNNFYDYPTKSRQYSVPAAANAMYSQMCTNCSQDLAGCRCGKSAAVDQTQTVDIDDEKMIESDEKPKENKKSKRDTVATLNTNSIVHKPENIMSELNPKVQIKPARKTAKYFISYFPPKLYCSPYKYDVLISLPATVFKTHRLAFRLIDGETNQQILFNTKSETSILVEKSKTIRKGNQVGYANASYRFCFNICSFHNLRRPFVLTAHLLKLKENEEEEIDDNNDQDLNEEHHYDHHDEKNICKEADSNDVICIYESEPFHIFARKTSKASEAWGEEENNLREIMAKAKRSETGAGKKRKSKLSRKIKKRPFVDTTSPVQEETEMKIEIAPPEIVIAPPAPAPVHEMLAPADVTEREAKKAKLSSPAAFRTVGVPPQQSPLSLLSPTTPSLFSFPSNIIDYNSSLKTAQVQQAPPFGGPAVDVANMYHQLNTSGSQVPALHTTSPFLSSDYYSKRVLEDFFSTL
jgi:hypothetical protein